ncbi:MAG: GIDE domain-containing protein [Candidatus Nanohaloarchaea archaeon]|nr:GIDE domain-containing protein [Candidatus Nanohaloarchaea archaeon]
MGRRPGQTEASVLMYAGVAVISLVVVAALMFMGTLPSDDDSFQILLLIAALFLGGNVMFIAGFGKLRRLNLIKNTPTSKVRSLAMGTVEVYGKVRPVQGETMESPFSGEPCVFYTYRVEEYKMQGDDKDWVTVAQGREGKSFYIDDGTGQVLVDPRGADLKVPEDNQFRVEGGEQPPQHIQQFIDRSDSLDSEDQDVDLGLFQVATGNDRRYHESFVTPGEEVYVFGEAMERPGKGSAQNEENIVINEKDTTPMFLISDSSEKELSENMGHIALFLLIGGPVLSILGFAGMLLMLGLL